MKARLWGRVVSVFVALITVPLAAAEPLQPQELADHQAVVAKVRDGAPYALDLSNPVEYRFYMKQLADAGITAKKRPQFFRALEQQRRTHVAGRYRPHTASDFINLAATDPSSPVSALTAVNAIAGLATNNTSSYNACAISSVSGGTISTAMTLRLFDTGSNSPIGQAVQGGDTSGAFFYDVDALGTDSGARVYALYTYSWVDHQGEYWGPFTARFTTMDVVPTITNVSPTSASVTAPIVVCINRDPITFPQCKYGSSTSNIVFPVSGNVQYANPIDVQNNVPTGAVVTWLVVDVTAGGGCNAWGPNAQSFFTAPATTISPDHKKITWNWQPTNFGAAPACIQQGHRMNYVFVLQVSSSGNPVSASITSTAPHVPGSNAIQIAQLQAYMGCFAAGTRIKMADGTWRPIEHFEMASERVASSGGRTLGVAGNTSGREDEMIRIIDRKGHTLLLTEGHPVVTRNRGVVLAKALTTSDTVITDEGDSRLVTVARVPFGGKVYNLDLGMAGESFGKDDTTMYAEHILVGDRRMQETYGQAKARTPEKIHASLPPEWREDYLNELDPQTARRLRASSKQATAKKSPAPKK